MSNLQKKIFELLDQGKDVIDIKHELGIPIWQITKIIENPETILNDEDNKILELYNEGTEIFDIKDKLGVPIWKIYKIIEDVNETDINTDSVINNADGLEFLEGGLSNEHLKELLGDEKYEENLLSKFLDIFDEKDKDEINKRGKNIKSSCLDCGFEKEIDKVRASLIMYKPSTLKYMGLINLRIVCDICESHRLKIQRVEDSLLILDPENETKCSVCDQAIILPRLLAQPDTNICNLCAANEDLPNSFLKNPLDKCPKCESGLIQVLDNDGESKIYCNRFRGTKYKENDSCDWIGFYDEYVINNIHDKEYLKIIKEFRSEISKREDVPLFYILTNQAIAEIVKNEPMNSKELKEKCPSVSENFIRKYSMQFFIILRKISKKNKVN